MFTASVMVMVSISYSTFFYLEQIMIDRVLNKLYSYSNNKEKTIKLSAKFAIFNSYMLNLNINNTNIKNGAVYESCVLYQLLWHRQTL